MDPFLRDRNCQPRYPSSFGSVKDIDNKPSFGGKTWVVKRINHQKLINLGGATSKKNNNYIYIYTHTFFLVVLKSTSLFSKQKNHRLPDLQYCWKPGFLCRDFARMGHSWVSQTWVDHPLNWLPAATRSALTRSL